MGKPKVALTLDSSLYRAASIRPMSQDCGLATADASSFLTCDGLLRGKHCTP
jgi:hypothetical protein